MHQWGSLIKMTSVSSHHLLQPSPVWHDCSHADAVTVGRENCINTYIHFLPVYILNIIIMTN